MPAAAVDVGSTAQLQFLSGVDLSMGTQAQLYASAVTCDPISREICITENRGMSFHILNDQGIELFRTLRYANLRNPRDGSLAADGSLYCLDLRPEGRGQTIRKLNLFGEPVEFTPEAPVAAWSPQNLVIAPTGELITLDATSGILVSHDAETGSLNWERSVFEGEVFDLGLGRPVCAADGRVFVPGGESHQVHVFSATGELLESFGKFGTGPAGLVFPVGIAFGPNESILVLDRMRHKILVFDSSFEYVSEVGQAGIWPGQFYHPLAIAASGDGRVFVSQGFQSRVQMFQLHFEDLN